MARISKLQNQAKIAEQLVDSLAYSESFSTKTNLNQNISPMLGDDSLPNYWDDLTKEHGKLVQRLDTKVEGNVVLVTVEFEKVTDTVLVIFDQQGQVVGLDFPQQ